MNNSLGDCALGSDPILVSLKQDSYSATVSRPHRAATNTTVKDYVVASTAGDKGGESSFQGGAASRGGSM